MAPFGLKRKKMIIKGMPWHQALIEIKGFNFNFSLLAIMLKFALAISKFYQKE